MVYALKIRTNPIRPRTARFKLASKNGSSTLTSPGKLIVNTANVSRSMTITAVLQSHQSRRSSFCSFSCNSARRASDEGSGWCKVGVGGDELMAGGGSRAKSEIHFTIIIAMENGDGSKCARRTGSPTALWYSSRLTYYIGAGPCFERF